MQARAYADSIEKPPARSVDAVITAQEHAAFARNIFSLETPELAQLAAALGDEGGKKGADEEGEQSEAEALERVLWGAEQGSVDRPRGLGGGAAARWTHVLILKLLG